MQVREQSRIRFLIVTMLFVASCFSYGDRVVLSIVGGDLSRQFSLTPLKLGYLFSGFSWAYVIAQLPAGGLLDRYGSKRGLRPKHHRLGTTGTGRRIHRLSPHCLGLPSSLRNQVSFRLRAIAGLPRQRKNRCRMVPHSGTRHSIRHLQFLSVFCFGTIRTGDGWLVHRYGWMACFWFGGGLSLLLSLLWFKVIYSVKSHPSISNAEISHIEAGGGLAAMDQNLAAGANPNQLTWTAVRLLLGNRMLVGIYIGQYCITTLTWFFLTWFPVYLNQARHMSILKTGLLVTIPALCGSIGGVSGGIVSDKLLRSGRSLSFARKLPIVLGMSLSMTMILCNYVTTQTLVIILMSLAFFGKGFGALGWTVIADVSPRNMIGINGGLFNLIGNLAGITTPIVIGYIVQKTGSFNLALVFVGVTALAAIIAYLPLVGKIHRVEFPRQSQEKATT